MRISWRITANKVSISLASLFGAVTLLQLTLAAYDIDIGRQWGVILLILTIVFALGAVAALLWPLRQTDLERAQAQRDEFERKLTTRKQNQPIRDWLIKSEAKWEYLRGANLSEIIELKQRCLELADELDQFLGERGHKEMDNLQAPELQRRSDETVELYCEHFMDKVTTLRKDLEQYDLWGLGVIDLQERDMVKNPTNYLSVRAIAEFLRSIANRL